MRFLTFNIRQCLRLTDEQGAAGAESRWSWSSDGWVWSSRAESRCGEAAEVESGDAGERQQPNPTRSDGRGKIRGFLGKGVQNEVNNFNN